MKTPKRHKDRSYNYSKLSDENLSIQSDSIIFNSLSNDKIKISELPESTVLDGSDLIPIVDISGTSLATKKITLSSFIDNTFNTEIIPSGENIKFAFSNNVLSIYTSPTGSFSDLLVTNTNISGLLTATSGNFTSLNINNIPINPGIDSNTNRYIFVQEGDSIIAKYAEAKLLNPDSSSLSATNRAYLIIMPGNYTISEDWTIDEDYVDIIGLESSSLNRGCVVSVNVLGNYDINITATDVIIKGIGSSTFARNNETSTLSGIFINCSGGEASFGSETIVNGTFINCTGGVGSFGGSGGSAAGTFINCAGGFGSFGGIQGIANGTFINCSGGNYSFGELEANGIFSDCSGEVDSFGGPGGIVNGTFIRCIGKSYSFGYLGNIGGIFIYCILIDGEFDFLEPGGIRRLCIDGDYNINNDTGI